MRRQARLLTTLLLVGLTVPVLLFYTRGWHHQNLRDSPHPLGHDSSTDTFTGPKNSREDSTTASSRRYRATSDSWKNHIQKSCYELGFNKDQHEFDPAVLKKSKILVDDRNKLLYCQIPKVASTTWRRIFIVLSGKVDTQDAMSLPANDVHHKYDKYLKHLTDYSREEILDRLNNYFKFVFVREPFERLLSAFRNKFETSTNSSLYFKRVFGEKIIRQYRYNMPSSNFSSSLQFQEFVDYLIDRERKIPMNEHWERFYKLCHPCLISYDFIGKLETLPEDSQDILERNSLSTKVKVPSRSDLRYSEHNTKSYMLKYYSQISKASLHKLFKHYFSDFVIFNFTLPEVIRSLM